MSNGHDGDRRPPRLRQVSGRTAKQTWEPLHHRAQQASILAGAARGARKFDVAIERYREAAALEQLALAAVPLAKVRTRAIVGISAAALLLKGEQYKAAESLICGLLAHGSLPEFAAHELRLTLETAWEEEALAAAGVRYSGEEIQVALKGGQIGSGTAPVDTALHYMGGFNSLCYRATEWAIGKDLRRSGPPGSDVLELLASRATQPGVGSYRFSIRLMEPRQMSMSITPDPRSEAPGKAASAVVDLVRALVDENHKRAEEIIPDERYRLVMMKLARNIVPSGASLEEVELRRAGEKVVDAIVLRSGARAGFTEAIRSMRLTEQQRTGKQVEVQGVLRVVDLNKRRLVIDEPGGTHRKILIRAEDAFDDVIGPMMNKVVQAAGVEVEGKGKEPVIILRDIDLRDDEPAGPGKKPPKS